MARTDPRPHYGSFRRVRSDGYVALWSPDHPIAQADGYVAEHRMVAWDAGLLADPADQVHHLNGDKSDNRLENLEVLGTAEHARLHAGRAGWAARNRAKTHCVRGHPLRGDNLLASQLPRRVCRACNNGKGKR